MGFLDALLGRTKPVPPNLDALFALPSAAITLQAATDFTPDGHRLGLLPRGRGPGVQRHREGRPRPAQHGREQDAGRGVRGQVRLHLAGLPPCRGRHRGPGHRPARGELLAGGRRLRPAAAVHDPQLPRRGRPPARAWCTCTSAARSTRSRRSRASAGTTRSSCRCAARSATTSRSSPTWAGGSRSGAPPVCNLPGGAGMQTVYQPARGTGMTGPGIWLRQQR